MKTETQITIGLKLKTYYGNGNFIGVKEVTRVSEKSVWVNGFRESWNTFYDNFECGIYKEF